MRVVVFSVFLFLLLFGGGENLYAFTKYPHTKDTSAHSQRKSHHVKIKEADQDSVLIDNAELDLEEDLLSGDDFSGDLSGHKFFAGKYGLVNQWYSAIARVLLFRLSNQSVQVRPACCNVSSPIYILQRVLRI